MKEFECWGLRFTGGHLWMLETTPPTICSMHKSKKDHVKYIKPHASAQNSPIASGGTHSGSQNLVNDIDGAHHLPPYLWPCAFPSFSSLILLQPHCILCAL